MKLSDLVWDQDEPDWISQSQTIQNKAGTKFASVFWHRTPNYYTLRIRLMSKNNTPDTERILGLDALELSCLLVDYEPQVP